MKTKKKKGFTLTELIVVIVIIGVLAAVMIPTLTGYITKAQNSKDETLVASLNRTYENTKIMDDIEIYTAYDVQAFLKEVDMENIEVANKSNLILFDTIEDKFVLVKENERNDAFYKEDNEGNLVLNNSGEFVINPSEYYKINHSFYEDTNALAVVNLEYSKLSHEHICKGTHRAFIVSTNGSEIAKASSKFMNLNYNMTSDELKDLYNNFNGYKDVNVRTLALNSISKTLFIDNVNGNNKAFYLSVEKVNNEYTYVKKEFNGGGQPTQVLTRVVTTGSVTNLDLDLVDELQRSTIFISGSVESIKETDSLGELINLVGNTLNVENLTNSIEVDYQLAMANLNIKEITYVNPYVKSEMELRELISKYKEITAEESTVKTEIESLVTKYPDITKWWENCNVIVNDSFVIKDEITIPEGIILTIPYDSNGSYDGEEDTNKIIKLKETDTEKLKYVLTVANNMTILGTLRVGGITDNVGQGTIGYTSSYYSQILIEENCELLIKGEAYVYGYIIGKGKVLLEGGKLVQPLIIGDYGGGKNTVCLLKLDSDGPFTPFSQYGISNVWCEINMDSNSKLLCRGKMYAGGFYETVVNVITGLTDESLIKLNNGATATITYDPENKIANSNNNIKGLGKTTIKISGGAKTGSFKLDLGELSLDSISTKKNVQDFIKAMFGDLLTADADTSTFILPLPFSFDFVFEDGDYEIWSKLAIFPGCKVTFKDNTSLKIIKGSELYIMDENVNGITYSGVGNYPTTYELSKANGYLTIGEIIVENVDIKVEGLLAGNIKVQDNCASTIYIDSDTGNCILEGKYKKCQNQEEHLICTKTDWYHSHNYKCYACGENPNNIEYINSGCCQATYTEKEQISINFGAKFDLLSINFKTINFEFALLSKGEYSYDSTSNSWKEKTE